MTREEILEKINKIRNLEGLFIDRYRSFRYSDESKEAFYRWYNAVIIFFHELDLDNNEDIKSFKAKKKLLNDDIKEMHNIFDGFSDSYNILLSDIENGKYPVTTKNRIPAATARTGEHPLIFISHASSDADMIEKFIDNLLKKGLGLRNDNIVCTSFNPTGVVPGEYIPQYIKEKIESAQVVLAMVSKAYKESEVCQNEVGAAWALNKKVIQILLPDVDFKELGWLLNLDKAAKIADQGSLDALMPVLCKDLGLNVVLPGDWNPCVNSFLSNLQQL